MKNIDFFVKKSNSFLSELNSIELITYDYGTPSKDLYGESFDSENTKFHKQKSKLNEIEFQMNLMLTEFDNGKLFIEKLKDYKQLERYHNNDKQLNHLLKVINKFIDFLKEYRV
jgi:hypothetical protein